VEVILTDLEPEIDVLAIKNLESLTCNILFSQSQYFIQVARFQTFKCPNL